MAATTSTPITLGWHSLKLRSLHAWVKSDKNQEIKASLQRMTETPSSQIKVSRRLLAPGKDIEPLAWLGNSENKLAFLKT